MNFVWEPLPAQPAPIDGVPFKRAFSFEAKCLDGEDAGEEVLYNTNSLGGTKAFDSLLLEIQKSLATRGAASSFPVLRLSSESYQNRTYGGDTFNPLFEIVGWSDTNGNLAGGNGQAVPKLDPAPQVSLKRSRNAEPAPPPPQEAPVSTTQARVGQRRRPGTV
jgi:hypothetical protein